MDKHIKILALIYIVIGCLLGIFVVLFHLKFISSADFFDNSITNYGSDFREIFDRYVELLGIYGLSVTDVLTSLLTIISSLTFGNGILA